MAGGDEDGRGLTVAVTGPTGDIGIAFIRALEASDAVDRIIGLANEREGEPFEALRQWLADGDHTIFVSGNDPGAKQRVRELLGSLGWQDIIDLGDITTSRGTEMYLPLWARLYMSLDNPMFTIKVVR